MGGCFLLLIQLCPFIPAQLADLGDGSYQGWKVSGEWSTSGLGQLCAEHSCLHLDKYHDTSFKVLTLMDPSASISVCVRVPQNIAHSFHSTVLHRYILMPERFMLEFTATQEMKTLDPSKPWSPSITKVELLQYITFAGFILRTQTHWDTNQIQILKLHCL